MKPRTLAATRMKADLETLTAEDPAEPRPVDAPKDRGDELVIP
jgi:hypothetical protein